MRMLSGLGVSCLVVATALAVGCGDDDSSGDQQGGAGSEEGGSANTSGSGGKSSGGTGNNAGETGNEGGEPTLGDAGSGGSTAMGGETGGGGVPGSSGSGAGGEGGGGNPPVDPNLCESFPVTVELGATIGLGQKGAIICLDPCRVTTNTYSDGQGACSDESPAVRFFTDSAQGGSYRANLSEGLQWDTVSAGEIDEQFPTELDTIPAATAITAVIAGADDSEYTVVFEFDDVDHLTITSFAEN